MRKALLLTVCILLSVAKGAQAGLAADLYLGGNFNQNIPLVIEGNAVYDGGGSIGPSTLNGIGLRWVYCVGRTTTVYVPADYVETWVTTTGEVYGNGFGPSASLNTVPQAAQIAYLLTRYADTPQVDQVALQAAIWHEVEPTVSLSASSTHYQNYQTYLANIGDGTAYVSLYDWLSPSQDGTRFYQGLVTSPGQQIFTQSEVPLPSAVWLLSSGFIGLAAMRKRLKK